LNNLDKKIYCLEYNEKQKQFHIHPIENRKKCSQESNDQWKIILTGLEEECDVSFIACSNLLKDLGIYKNVFEK